MYINAEELVQILQKISNSVKRREVILTFIKVYPELEDQDVIIQALKEIK